MKRTSLFIAGLLIAAAASQAHANLLFYDSFNYAPATSLGTAGTPTWAKNGASPDPTVQNVGGLSFPGLVVSGDTLSLQYDGSGINTGSGNPAATDGTTLSAGGISTDSLYYSLLMKVTAIQTFGGGTGNGFATGTANLTQGSFMAGMQTIAASSAPGTLTTAGPLLIRSGDGTQFSPTYQLGTCRTTTPADRQFYTGQAFNVNDTVFVVVKYDFGATTASLFINPTPGSSEGSAQLTVSGGAALTLNTGVKSFFVRNNSVEPDALLIDELRIGTTWADVTPAPEPGAAALAIVGGFALLALRKLRSPV